MKKILLAASLCFTLPTFANNANNGTVNDANVVVETPQNVVATDVNIADLKEVDDILKRCGWFALATTDGDQPQARPFGATCIYNGGIYLISGKRKAVARQVEANPKACIMGLMADTGGWVRINTTLVADETIAAKEAMLEANPDLKGMYSATDDNMIIWKLTDATATIYDGPQPKVIKF